MAVQSSSTTVKLLESLGVDGLVIQLNKLQEEQARLSQGAQEFGATYRDFKAKAETRKGEILVRVSSDNEGQAEAKIERALKLALVGDEEYSEYTNEARSAQDILAEYESSLRVTETQIRSLQTRMSTIAAAMHVAAADRRAKTAATLLGAQANAIAAGNL